MILAVNVGPQTRVLVTGASRGIGRATAEAFAERGCSVGLVARRADDLEVLVPELQVRAASVLALPADVSDRESVREAVERFVAEVGGLDVVVVNAGVAYYGGFRDLPPEEAERMTRVNWLGTVWTVQAALPHLEEAGTKRVVIVSSAAGHRAFPSAAVYGATKAAQKGFLEALRHELAGTGIGVTGVYPGEVKTHLHDDDRVHDRMPDWYRADAAIPPKKVAGAIVEAVERERDSVFVPPITRLLRIVNGISPSLSDRMLRRIMGRAAAPAS
jgi:NADP-dependent 3-hydroxy acid dehydrogenase YdfG